MKFDKEWTQFALDAEVEMFGTNRIAKAHNDAIKQFKKDLLQLDAPVATVKGSAMYFAEYIAKKAEEYMEEYNLLEEERLAQSFNDKKDNEKLFKMEEDIGETATQLKIYIYEFRKRNPFHA